MLYEVITVAARRHRDPGRATRAALVARVEQEGLVEARHELRAAAQELVVDGDRAHDPARAAGARRAQAET